jgi:hypothetical protein
MCEARKQGMYVEEATSPSTIAESLVIEENPFSNTVINVYNV